MKKLNKYYAGLFSILLKQLSKYERKADHETLHKIRITIKKIRSVFRLTGFCDKNFNERKHFHPLKKIFKDAGVIRESYIAGKLYEEYGINKETDNNNLIYDNEKRMEDISGFIKNTKRNCKVVYDKYFDTKQYPGNVSEECYYEYFINRQTELRNLVFPDLIEAKLHNARRICKEITFLFEISSNSEKKTDPFFDKLQVMIGEWHDKIELLKLMSYDDKNITENKIKELERSIGSEVSSIKELINAFYLNSN